MKNTVSIALLCVACVLFPVVSGVIAATYYVKPTGSDANSGLTVALAWQHMHKACSTLVAGDTVFIRSGWYDETSAENGESPGMQAEYGLRPMNTGTAGNEIVFKGYPGDSRPIHVGNSTANGTNLRVATYLGGKSYLIYDSIEFRFGYRGIQIPSGNDIIIRNCVIDSTLGPDNNNNGGIALLFTAHGEDITWNITVEYCEIFANGAWNGSTADYTQAYNTSGIHNYGCDSCIFRYNVIHDEANGIALKHSARFSEIYGNVIHDVDIAMWTVWAGCMWCPADELVEAVWHHNVAYNIGSLCFLVGYGDDVERDSLIYWYNNTCDCDETAGGIQSQYGGWVKSFFFNNIIYKPHYSSDGGGNYTSAFGFKNDYAYPEAIYEDHNIMYGLSSGDHYYIWHPDADKNLAEWQAALPSGVVAGSAQHNTIQDPLFVNAANHDYHLQSGSPAASGGRGGSWPTYRGAYAPADAPPVAAFYGTPTSGTAPLTVNFTDQSSQSPTYYSWLFGDGDSSNVQNPSNEYAVGTYTVTLHVWNAYGDDGETKTNYIVVSEAGGTSTFKFDASGNISIGR